MFTGLISDVGRVTQVRGRGDGLRIAITHRLEGEEIETGESVAVDGCCLTALGVSRGRFEADLSRETVSKTGGRARWRVGRRVNLERALRAGDRLGGHIVQGHVDGLLRLLGRESQRSGGALFRFSLAEESAHFVVPKGSICLDGVSLTVARLGADDFDVALIPETLRATTLDLRRPGDAFLVEYDVLGKYVERMLARGETGNSLRRDP